MDKLISYMPMGMFGVGAFEYLLMSASNQSTSISIALANFKRYSEFYSLSIPTAIHLSSSVTYGRTH